MPAITRRHALSATSAALAGPVLAACGGPGGSESAPAQSQQPITVDYMHQWSPTQGHGPITDTLVARWNQENPTTTFTATFANQNSDYYTKVAAMLASGDFPDLITYNLAQVPLLVQKKVIVPAETLSKGSARLNLNDLVPAAREMATFAQG